MTIEFRCTGCNQLLRVQDGLAGKKAKCPQCETILVIPEPAVLESTPFDEAAATPPDSDNPFASPLAMDVGHPASEPMVDRKIVPTKISLEDVYKRGWEIFKVQWGILVGAFCIVAFLNYVVSNGMVLLGMLAAQAIGEFGEVFLVIAQIAANAWSIFLGIGQAILVLNVVRGREASLADLFAGSRFFWRIVGASILFALMVMGGFLLLIVPGIILSLMFGQFYYLIIDKNLGVFESLSVSREITYGNKLTLFAIMLVAIGVMILGLLACCVGVLVAGPYVGAVTAVAYLMMAGQSTAGPKGYVAQEA